MVVVGSDTWLRPDDLELGDNRRFLLNAVQWLAGGGGDVAYVPPVGPKVDERDFAPRVRPACEVACHRRALAGIGLRHWTRSSSREWKNGVAAP